MILDPSPANTETMIPVAKIPTSGIDCADDVEGLAKEAEAYLASMSWCKKITRGWLSYACGYVIGIFYFQIVPARQDVPHFVWVIVGDIPPAYMDGEFHRSDSEALEAYVTEMQEWVDRVMQGRPLDDDVISVNVPPERKWAEELQHRLNSIRTLFLESL